MTRSGPEGCESIPEMDNFLKLKSVLPNFLSANLTNPGKYTDQHAHNSHHYYHQYHHNQLRFASPHTCIEASDDMCWSVTDELFCALAQIVWDTAFPLPFRDTVSP